MVESPWLSFLTIFQKLFGVDTYLSKHEFGAQKSNSVDVFGGNLRSKIGFCQINIEFSSSLVRLEVFIFLKCQVLFIDCRFALKNKSLGTVNGNYHSVLQFFGSFTCSDNTSNAQLS